MPTATFERYERKYLLTGEQYNLLLEKFRGRMENDRYGLYRVSNLYYDTDRFDLLSAHKVSA
ncbi:MAG: hypothetical protein LBQ88_20395 [Treponema sp.]|nr:hypothetical protein [Treponema sp.]